jgi:hypothetical protein
MLNKNKNNYETERKYFSSCCPINCNCQCLNDISIVFQIYADTHFINFSNDYSFDIAVINYLLPTLITRL